MKKIITAVLLFAFASQAWAGSCVLHYKRAACPGKEAMSFKKCDGKAECDKVIEVKTEEECAVKAVSACANDRLDITKSKVMSATFNGKPVKNKAGGADHCMDYDQRAAEFDQCGM